MFVNFRATPCNKRILHREKDREATENHREKIPV